MGTSLTDSRPVDGLEHFSVDFIRDRLAELELIDEAQNKGEFVALSKLAHRWKGFCDPYGFTGLKELVVGLEDAANTENSQQVEFYVKEIFSYLKEKEKLL